MDWDKVVQDFPAGQSRVWLNNCGVALTPGVAYDTLNKAITESKSGHLNLPSFDYGEVRDRLRGLLAQLLNVDTQEILLMQNTAQAMNLFAYGYPLSPGKKILLLEDEYPSNVYPWQTLEKKGHQIIFANPDQVLESISQHRADLGIVSLSPVHWITGQRMPLNEIASLCREAGIELVLDGAQSVGHISIKPRELGVRFMGFSCWKWLMGPLGLSAAYISRELWDQLPPPFPGTSNVINDEQYLPYRDQLKDDAERYMISTQPFLPWVQAMAALEYLSALGFEKVQNRILDLAFFTRMQLEKQDFTLATPVSEKSGIVSFKSSVVNSESLLQRLAGQNIFTALRGGYIRVSPHICNSEQQISILLQEIKHAT